MQDESNQNNIKEIRPEPILLKQHQSAFNIEPEGIQDNSNSDKDSPQLELLVLSEGLEAP